MVDLIEEELGGASPERNRDSPSSPGTSRRSRMKPIGPKNERAAIISGAGSGLGRAIAKELVEAGIRCVITGRRRAALEQTADIIAGDRSRVLVVQGDVTAREDRARVLGECLERLGRVDILVNNAGISSAAPLLEYGEQEWRQGDLVHLCGTHSRGS